ncbi:MAG: hypothetical protein WKG01_36815 [Kofleriaceae bacterium]
MPNTDPNTTWYLIIPQQLDAAAGTFDTRGDQEGTCPHPMSIANARVIVEQASR